MLLTTKLNLLLITSSFALPTLARVPHHQKFGMVRRNKGLIPRQSNATETVDSRTHRGGSSSGGMGNGTHTTNGTHVDGHGNGNSNGNGLGSNGRGGDGDNCDDDDDSEIDGEGSGDDDCDDSSPDGEHGAGENFDESGSTSGGDDNIDPQLLCQNHIATTPSNILSGSLTGDEGCTGWTTTVQGDTCNSILAASSSSFTLEGFLRANPSINGATCSNLPVSVSVCTAGPAEIQFGSTDINAGCNFYYCVVKDDDCIIVANKLGNNVTSVEELILLNPEFGQKCLNMWLGSWICAAGSDGNLVSPTTVTTPIDNYGNTATTTV